MCVLYVLISLKFPTIPIWSNRWTRTLKQLVNQLRRMVSFQLFRFEVIGEQGWRLRSNEMGWNCFQLFRFEVIGEPFLTSMSRWRWRSFQLFRFEVIGEQSPWMVILQLQKKSFQLFRFEVIGELCFQTSTLPQGWRMKFPTIPIWSNRWTGVPSILVTLFGEKEEVSNYSDLK